MTSRERLTAAARGGETDRKPVILWGHWSNRADACVLPLAQMQVEESTPVLVEVASPFTRSLRAGQDLNSKLYEDPEAGNTDLDELCNETTTEIATALDRGAFGIAYVLDGASPAKSTPMQYGGYYLERDREILSQFESAPFNLLLVEGREEVYLDSVSDLAADAIAWHREGSEFTLEMMRALRPGALAGEEPDSDLELVFTPEALEATLTRLGNSEVLV